jgi:hypothetical protein
VRGTWAVDVRRDPRMSVRVSTVTDYREVLTTTVYPSVDGVCGVH